ncbi:hypothetical protein SAMN05421504_110271 [Amycolatopsis xylanica]|uniref:Uncharacterized protein n=1 Tax=Amycolatopsis xylanica TaxID=589385 RepID=A0A1H3R568_9PSEU|nr:hypothetical protein [Amycolatopsis xylanica]SDZ20663.1 hypothetical protein SAMN05421504_110271 [Amycolatopsis xylanica]
MARKSPQEKKALSYAKDRRNDYGENDKSSRKNIRRNKQFPNRADRHRERQVLATAAGPVAFESAEKAETRLAAKKSMWLTKGWRKWRDAPLADTVISKLQRRAKLGMDDPADVDARVERIRRASQRKR